MNGNNILLDTNAIIYFLNGKFLLDNEYNIFISIISEIELLCYPKITSKEENIIKDFLNSINIINLDNYIKNETILIKKEISIKLPDAIILATAKINNLILLTQDEGILKYNGYKNIDIRKCF
ncbi:PilT domain-containing protein [Brachyspira intermedia PWS/A]|uniref:PilT domain-containing protein n=1 Tax=Brachyspira intermedia (strain ATCC 51140 / PWS/A) TaxID=1045858 RepID=G0EJV6_BRAIP|nr:PIN domain-containing protein [Brachyspira intermedia]AEM21225.1 PilT domain-containing protein [Brachyspira intermedia PWS/A]